MVALLSIAATRASRAVVSGGGTSKCPSKSSIVWNRKRFWMGDDNSYKAVVRPNVLTTGTVEDFDMF